ncbi:MAG: nitrous oxide reductase accessory protein NosL [Thermoanaerobaculia bacterium]
MRSSMPWVGAVALCVGCAGSAPAGPPELALGLDACARCGMVIDDPRFAAALRTAAGETRLYDDIGELVADMEETGVEPVEAWVHDFEDEHWLRAREAVPVHGSVPTPMGSGLVACRTRAAARRWAAENGGQVLTWGSLGAIAGRLDTRPTTP